MRLTEIAGEMKSVAARDDAGGAVKLIAEGARLAALEGLTRFNEVGKIAAGAVGSVLSTFNIASAVQEYTRFRSAAAEDARLLRREIDLKRQLANLPDASASPKKTSSEITRTTQSGRPKEEPPAQRDFTELDDALTLLRFSETKDWAVEDKKNMARIAAKYPEIDREYRAALEREVGQHGQGPSTYTGSDTKRQVSNSGVVTEVLTVVLTVGGKGTANEPHRGTFEASVVSTFTEPSQTRTGTLQWRGSFSSLSPKLNVEARLMDVKGGFSRVCAPALRFSAAVATDSIQGTLLFSDSCTGSTNSRQLTLTRQ
jgi:hypothetical protein